MRGVWISLLVVACQAGEPPRAPAAAAGEPAAEPARHEHPSRDEHPPQGAAPPPADHQHHGPIGHRFEDAEQWAKRFDDPSRDAWQMPRHVVDLMELRPAMHVVDLGAGTGYFIPHLSSAVGAQGRVIALDVEPDMVRYLKARARREGLSNVEVRQVTSEEPGLEPSSVQRVLIVDTWHHLGARASYARKLAAALEPGGRVYVVDFTLETQRGPPRDHRVAPEQVVSELSAGGLNARVLPESLPDQYVVVGEK